MKKSIIYKLAAVLGVIGMAVFVVAGAGLASGLSYQSRVDVEFTFEPSLSLTVSAPLRIDDLDPGMMAESNTIQVTVGTNNAYGYTLTATTGNASNPSRELRHSSYLSAGDPVFSSLPLNANLSKTEFLNNSDYNDYWGYSTDGETYNGLPLYSDTENAVTLLSSNYMPENGTATTNFMLGAKASMDKEAGSYSNVINFVAVGAIDPTTFMQNWAGCKNLKTGRTTTLVDSRDYKTYKVAKLADGKCWMLDNLALDLTTVSLNDLKGNTNASDEVLTYLKNGGGSGQYPANGVIAKTSNSGSWTNSYTDPYIATGYISTVPQGNNDPLKTETSNGNWKIGVYYNYCAASAGSYCYSTSNAPTDSQNGVRNIDADICPKGWHMPTGNTSGEYSALANAIYGSTGSTSDATAYANYRSALRLPLSGYFYDGSAGYQGSYGYWWSSTRRSNYGMYRLFANTSSINPALSNDRYNGISVRCVMEPPKTIGDIEYMQDFANLSEDDMASVLASMKEGEAYTKKDNRDETEYRIGKLADGKVWLLDNLALDLTDNTILSNLSSDNTNASTGLPYLKGTSTGTTSDRYATAKVANWTSSYSYSAPLVSMADKDKTAPTGTSSDPKQSLATSNNWKYGGYYNYCAASAGSYCYGNGTSAGTSYANVTEDICPKGWRMPTGNSGEYQTLYSNTNYNTYDKYREALRLPLSGYFNSGSAINQGSVGRWWSSTRSDNNRIYILYAGTSDINPAYNSYRSSGNSVRCVLGS